MPPTFTTGGLALKKPATVDSALIGDLNTNADLVDAGTARVINVKGAGYGAVGDGVADDRAAILAAETALGAGGMLFFPAGTYRIATSMGLKSTTHLMLNGGATLAPATSTTTTIAGMVRAGTYQVFAGAGTIVLSYAQTVYPEWWGAVADVKTAQTGGAITSGQTTLTTGGTFAATDVGKLAVVLGAGASGAPLVTTVAAFISATQVTLGAAASTTVSTSRWAIGSNATAALNACLAAAAAGSPVVLSGLYGTTGVLLNAAQVLVGNSMEFTGVYRLGTGAGGPTVSLKSGVSGDSVCLASFLVNGMFIGTYDGVEIGTASAPLALASGGYVRHVKVRNAAAWGFNIRCNVAFFENLWAQHDQAPPSGNTTAGGMRFIDTLAYADALTVEGFAVAGAFSLGAGGGSVYNGLQIEVQGTYATIDLITVASSQQIINGVYATLGTHRDLIRILTGVRDIDVTLVSIKGTHTLTNVLNDIDRAITIAPTGTDFAYARYWTTGNTGLMNHDGGGGWKIRKTGAPDLVLSDSNAFSSGVTRSMAIRGEALNPNSAYIVAGGVRLDMTPLTGRTNIDQGGALEFVNSAVSGATVDALSWDQKGNVVVGIGALATNVTDGFLYVASCAGAPTGTPTAKTGRVPVVYDTTNNKLWVYNSGWKGVVLA